jgi:hypothetical protein
MKMQNADFNKFTIFFNKEVFILGGPQKGYRATLYSLSIDTCTIEPHDQPWITINCCDIVTRWVYSG